MKSLFVRRFRRKRRSSRRLRVAVPVFLCVVALVVLALVQCRPVMTAFAESQAVWDATKLANQTAIQVLSEHDDLCRQMISVEYDGAQRVAAVYTDTSGINMVRSAMTDRVMQIMEQSVAMTVAIPLGTLSGWRWLSGLGPVLTFPFSFTATVLSDISSSLVATGINQTTYQVVIHLDISLYVVSPMGSSTVGTRVSFPMAEAVLSQL